MKKSRIKEYINSSRDVIEECSLENGAIVAADSDKSLYPSSVQNYRHVWIRDAAYICIAADILGLRDIPEKFFRWCISNAEGFAQTGIFHNAYNVNGTINGTIIPHEAVRIPRQIQERYLNISHHGTQFQPDQNGILLFAIAHHIRTFRLRKISAYRDIISLTAEGICILWKKDRFIMPYFDLWEERCIEPAQRRHHTYTLAVCIAGLRAAMKFTGTNDIIAATEKQMSDVFSSLYKEKKGAIPRTYNMSRSGKQVKNRRQDNQPDSSLLGLVYPAGLVEPFDERMRATVQKILSVNSTEDGGLLRYTRDKYCGGVKNDWVTLTGAGAWPIFSFWMAIYYTLCGDKKTAEKHFFWSLKMANKYLPEQIFRDSSKPSVIPLAWSHAMFIIAANFLGYIDPVE